jgi:hypothetical protein
MKRLIIGFIVPFAAALGLWLGVAGGTAGAHTAQQATRPTVTNVVDSRTTSAVSHRSSTRQETGTTDRSSEGGENGNGEGENGNDGPGGHEDPPGNVNHECTGNCQE